MSRVAVPLAEVVPADGRVAQGASPVAVAVSGRYDPTHQFLVPGRTQGGSAAVYVVTPLVPSTGPAVLVVRGWIAPDPGGVEPAPPLPPGDRVVVTGWLAPSEPLEAGTVDPLVLPAGQLATVTAARASGLLPFPILDGYVGAVEEQVDRTATAAGPAVPPGARPLTRLAVPVVPPTTQWSVQSLSYAIEWWFFGLVACWMWVQALRIERRKPTAPASLVRD